MELRTTMIALVIGLMVFTAGVTVYGEFIDKYSIDTDSEYEKTYDRIGNLTSFMGETENAAKNIGREMQQGNSSTGGEEPEVSLWRAGINTLSLFWTSIPIVWDTIEIIAYRLGIPHFYVSGILIIIITIIGFALVSAVLRQKI